MATTKHNDNEPMEIDQIVKITTSAITKPAKMTRVKV
jgi:hypothetical protein